MLKTRSRIATVIISFFMAIFLFFGTAFALLYHDISSSIKTADVKHFLPEEEEDSYVDSFDGRSLNILLLGMDSPEDGNGKILDNGVARSDTTLILHISADRQHATFVSIPRDTIVDIPSCTRNDGTKTFPQHAQFNWAFSIDSVENGPAAPIACTWKTVEQNTGLDLDAYVLVDFKGFEQMINALGGVDLYLEERINAPSAQLKLDAGCHHLDGQEALKYARAREGVADGSDLSRIKRQHYLLSIMFRTALSKSLITESGKLYQFVREGLRSLTVSESIGDISTLTGLAYSMKDIDPKNIEFITAPVIDDPANPNRVIFHEPLASDVWLALRTESELPAGLPVRNGSGEEYVSVGNNKSSDLSPSSEDSSKNQTSNPSELSANNNSSSSDVNKAEQHNHDSQIGGAPQPSFDPHAEARARCEPQ